ncbi:hypothetical protein GWK47_047526 [Chionoecetes opilio]|uniref:Uncharacterized protein n=1 Tax=Chionoecetes opilio TaxID=41210 RepID=A0A8J4YBW1_CHIOP|nr:hypothetical protein GWK47_047526 [Chionoecetes opilio]
MKKRYLVAPLEAIPGAQLPSAREVPGLVIYKLDVQKKAIRVWAHEVSLVVEEVCARARIPLQRIDKVATKIQKLHKEYALIRKNKKCTTSTQVSEQRSLGEKLNDLFDVAHANAMAIMTEAEDEDFLLAQRGLVDVGEGRRDPVKAAPWERVAERHAAQTSRQEEGALNEAATSSATVELNHPAAAALLSVAPAPLEAPTAGPQWPPTEPKRAKRGLKKSFDPGVSSIPRSRGRRTRAITRAHVLKFERALDKDLLYFACRHHVLELVIGAVFLSAMGPTAGPDVALFRHFQAKWEFIDQQQYVTGAATEDVAHLLLEVDAEWFRKCSDEPHGTPR